MLDNEQSPQPSDELTPNDNQTEAAPASPVTTAPTDETPKPIAQPAPVVNTPSNKSGSKKKLGLLAAVIAALVVLIGGSAGAYYGLVVPNKPENVLKSAFKNSLLQTKGKFNGKISVENTEKDAEVKAVNVTLNGQQDSEKKAFQVAAEVTAAGVKVPFEVRSVDKSVFFKMGDLGTLKALATLASPEAGPIIDEVNKKIANQWIEIDETLLKQAQADCALDASYSLTKQDVDLLINRYKQVPFASYKSSNDTVDGKAAIKYEIAIDDNKGAEYAKGLSELSIVKKLKECYPDDKMDNDDFAKSLADNDTTPLTLWVSKSDKQIIKIAGHSTEQDEQKEHFKASFEITIQYGQADISKPEGAKPLMEVIGDLGALFGGAMGGGGLDQSMSDIEGIDDLSDECLAAYQAFVASEGATPVPANCQ